MRTLFVLALALSAASAHAGGTEWRRSYTGKHPITKTQMTLAMPDRNHVRLDVERTVAGHASDLVLSEFSRTIDPFERVFELRESGGANARLVANVVTTGDCQRVESLLVIFPSGATARLTATSNE